MNRIIIRLLLLVFSLFANKISIAANFFTPHLVINPLEQSPGLRVFKKHDRILRLIDSSLDIRVSVETITVEDATSRDSVVIRINDNGFYFEEEKDDFANQEIKLSEVATNMHGNKIRKGLVFLHAVITNYGPATQLEFSGIEPTIHYDEYDLNLAAKGNWIKQENHYKATFRSLLDTELLDGQLPPIRPRLIDLSLVPQENLVKRGDHYVPKLEYLDSLFKKEKKTKFEKVNEKTRSKILNFSEFKVSMKALDFNNDNTEFRGDSKRKEIVIKDNLIILPERSTILVKWILTYMGEKSKFLDFLPIGYMPERCSDYGLDIEKYNWEEKSVLYDTNTTLLGTCFLSKEIVTPRPCLHGLNLSKLDVYKFLNNRAPTNNLLKEWWPEDDPPNSANRADKEKERDRWVRASYLDHDITNGIYLKRAENLRIILEQKLQLNFKDWDKTAIVSFNAFKARRMGGTR
jgi:hypothetical protein